WTHHFVAPFRKPALLSKLSYRVKAYGQKSQTTAFRNLVQARKVAADFALNIFQITLRRAGEFHLAAGFNRQAIHLACVNFNQDVLLVNQIVRVRSKASEHALNLCGVDASVIALQVITEK